MQYFMIHAHENGAYTSTGLCGHDIQEATLLYMVTFGVDEEDIEKVEVIPETKMPKVWKRHYQKKTEEMLNRFTERYMR